MYFALGGDLIPPSVVSIKMDIAFAADGNKISLQITEVLLRAAVGNLTRSKKQRDWTPRHTVLLPPLLTESAILNKELDTSKLLNIFARSITDWARERENASGEDDDDDKDEDKDEYKDKDEDKDEDKDKDKVKDKDKYRKGGVELDE